MYDQVTDTDLVLLLTSSASLDRSPKKNWVENAGNLPPYVRKLARAIEKDGKSLSSAIAIAISRIKKWAAGGDDVDADTVAKATKALAEWEALKAKSAAGKTIKASNLDGEDYVFFSAVPSYNTDIIRRAWDIIERARREAWNQAHKKDAEFDSGDARAEVAPGNYYPYRWIRETWSDFLVIENEELQRGQNLFKVPYTVAAGNEVVFGEEIPVIQEYVEKDALSKSEIEALKDLLSPVARLTALAEAG